MNYSATIIADHM